MPTSCTGIGVSATTPSSPPQGGRFCDGLVDGEIVIHPHSSSDVMAEFKSPRMKWSGEFHRYSPGG